MAEKHKVVITIDGVDKFKGTFDKLSKSTKKAKEQQEKLNRTAQSSVLTYQNLQRVVTGYVALRLGRFLAESARLTGVQEDAVKLLTVALKNQNALYPETISDLEQYASSLQKVTKFGDEAILSLQSQLVGFGIVGDELKRATKVALDFATATGRDVTTSALLLGKAFAGETGELSRYGIVLDQAIPKSEKFAEVMKLMNERYGGAAQAAAETYAGKVEQLSNRFGDLRERIGAEVIPVFEFWMRTANDVIGVVERLSGGTSQMSTNLSATEKRLVATREESAKLNEVLQQMNTLNKLGDHATMEYNGQQRTAQELAVMRINLIRTVIPMLEREVELEKAKGANIQQTSALAAKAAEERIEQEAKVAIAIGQMTTATYTEKKKALIAEEKMRVKKMKAEIKDSETFRKYKLASDRQLSEHKFQLMKAEAEMGLETTQFMIGLAISAFGKSKDLARAQLVVNQALAISRATQLIGIPFVGPALYATAVGLITAATVKQWKSIGDAGAGLQTASLNLDTGSVAGRPTGTEITGDGDTGPVVVRGTAGDDVGITSGGGGGRVVGSGGGAGIIFNVSNQFDIDLRIDNLDSEERVQLIREITEDLRKSQTDAVDMAVQVYRTGELNSTQQ